MIWQYPMIVAAFAAIPFLTVARRLREPRAGELYVQHDQDLLRIYTKGGNRHGSAWIEHQIRHERNLSQDAAPDERYDVWRSVEVWEALRKGMSFTRTRCIVQNGETEFAIAAPGPAPGRKGVVYMGGRAHGNEFAGTVTLHVDGRPRPIEDTGVYRCAELRLTIVSTVFHHGGETTPQGRREKPLCRKTSTWTFARGERLLEQRLEFVAPLTVRMLYLAMLPIRRRGALDDLITAQAACAPDWAPVDVAGVDRPWPASQAGHIRVWGSTGIRAEVEVLKGWDRPNRRSRIANRKFYNKVYFDFLGEGGQVQAGDVLEAAARYRIDTDL